MQVADEKHDFNKWWPSECFVLWDNRKEYRAYYLLSGKLYS